MSVCRWNKPCARSSGFSLRRLLLRCKRKCGIRPQRRAGTASYRPVRDRALGVSSAVDVVYFNSVQNSPYVHLLLS